MENQTTVEVMTDDIPLPVTISSPGASYVAPSRSRYNRDLLEKILECIEAGYSVQKAADKYGFPESDIRYWVSCDAVLAAKFARAKAGLAHALISDGLNAQDRLRDFNTKAPKDYRRTTAWVAAMKSVSEQRMKYAERLAPSEYGEKSTIQHTGPNGGPIEITPVLSARFEQLYAWREVRTLPAPEEDDED